MFWRLELYSNPYGRKETPAEYAARRARNEAEKQQRQAERAQREHAKQQLQNAHQLRKAGHFQQAISAYSRAIQFKPDHKGAYLYRGICYQHLRQYSQALSDYQQSASISDPMFKNQQILDQKLGSIYQILAEQHYANKQYVRALQYGKQAETYLSNSEQYAYCVYYQGLCAQHQANYQLAVQFFERAISHDVNNVLFYQETSFSYKKAIMHNNQQHQLLTRYQQFLQQAKSKFQHEDWLQDDLRWHKLLNKHLTASSYSRSQPSSIPIKVARHIKHQEQGDAQFIKQILNWKITNLQTATKLIALSSKYPDTNQYYDAMLPLILEETRAAMYQYFLDSSRDVKLSISKYQIAKDETNPSKLFVHKFPRWICNDSQSDLALLLTFRAPAGQIINCLGLATITDDKMQIKMIAESHIIKSLRELNARYLGGITTYKRMYAVCHNKPASILIKQLATLSLPHFVTNLNHQLTSASAQNLDISQQAAVNHFLALPANNIALLQGPPGTGKTTTIVALVHECINRGMRLLISAPSNKAIQEIVTRVVSQFPTEKILLAGVEEKLTDELLPIFVHGWYDYYRKQTTKIIKSFSRPNRRNFTMLTDQRYLITIDKISQQFSKFHPDSTTEFNIIKKNVVSCVNILSNLTETEKKHWLQNNQKNEKVYISDKQKTYSQLIGKVEKLANSLFHKYHDTPESELNLLDDARIVFASLSVCGRNTMQRMQTTFDITIIDEAGQALPAEVLIALQYQTRKALLVGDPMQLPATTFSASAKETHFDQSVLGHLIQHHMPYKQLQFQYRMHSEIRYFPAHEFYNGKLQDGDSIKSRADKLIAFSNTMLFPYSVVDVASGLDGKIGTSYHNQAECNMVLRLVNYIHQADKTLHIGIITFYSVQLDKIKQSLDHTLNVTAATVDGFQGGECDIIVMSCVRANSSGQVGFAKDFRRINVALTRARYGLIVIGNRRSLAYGNHVLAKMIQDANCRNKIITESAINQLLSPAASHSSSNSSRMEKWQSNKRDSQRQHISRPCKFFAEGHCRKGEQCNFAHVSDKSNIRKMSKR